MFAEQNAKKYKLEKKSLLKSFIQLDWDVLSTMNA